MVQEVERIGDRLRRVVCVGSDVPADGVSFRDGFDSDHIRRSLAEHGGVWRPGPRWNPGHWPMFSRPKDLVRRLKEAGARR
ncbi:hypothetical protein [Streptomyces sp. NPDC001153]